MIMSTNTEKSCPLVSFIDFKKHRKSIVITRTFHTTFVYAKSAKMLFYYQKESQELHLSRFRVALQWGPSWERIHGWNRGCSGKNAVFRKGLSGKVKISNSKEFAEYMNHINEVHSLNLPADEIPPEPEEVANATAIPDTLKSLGIVRGLSKHSIPYLKFFFLSNDKEPNCTQWYGPERNHADNSVGKNTCAFCLRKYYLSGDMNGCNVQYVKARSTKTVFSVDIYIYSSVEVQNFWCNLVNVS